MSHCHALRRTPRLYALYLFAGVALVASAGAAALCIDRQDELGCRLDSVRASTGFVGRDLAKLRAEVEGLRAAVAEESVRRGHQIAFERAERRKDLGRAAAEASDAIGLVLAEQDAEHSAIGRTGANIAALAGRVDALAARACRCGPPPPPCPCDRTPPKPTGPAATPPAPSKSLPG